MSGTYEDLTNQEFGYLKVKRIATKQEILEQRPKLLNTKGKKWLCECKCGNIKIASAHELKQKTVQSCGCLNDQRRRERAKHGFWQHPLYGVWIDMKARCYNPNDKYYDRYGGRGIKVCDKWLHDFKAFYDDMIEGYIPGEVCIDRIDNDGNYCKENCRWLTNQQNQNNKSTNRFIEYYGKEYTLAQLGEKFSNGQKSRTISRKLDSGWTVDEALYLPKLGGVHKGTYLDSHKLVTKPILFDKDLDTEQPIIFDDNTPVGTFTNYNNFFRIVDKE